MDITKMKVTELVKYLFTASDDELIQIVKSGQLNLLNEELFRSFFLKNNYNIKNLIINDESLFDRLINLKPNIHKRTILDVIDEQTLDLIIKSPFCLKYSDKIITFLTGIKLHKFDELTKNIDFISIIDDNSFLKNEEKMIKNLITRGFNHDLVINLIVKIRTGTISPICVLKLENNYQLLLLTKFNTLINVQEEGENIVFDNGEKISSNLINSLSTKHLMGLFKLFQTKNSDNNTNNIIAAIKLYCVFGYDNAAKIIKDHFTYLTPTSINRIVDTNFKDIRRAFRLENQNKFYYYGLEKLILKEINRIPINLEFFNDFVFNDSSEETLNLINYISKEIKDVDISTSEQIIRNIIITQINLREEKYKKQFENDTKKRINNKKKRKPISALNILNLLNRLNLDNIKLDSKGQVIPNSRLQEFLLGTTKKDNDCLFRLIVNEEALGLNYILDDIINHFDEITHIIDNSNNTLSLNSILDIIDISKTTLYDMEPDLCDITLETLAKIIHSKEHLEENEETIVKRAYDLHRRRKFKTYSSIPMVKGSYHNLKYEVIPFDAEYLLCAGIDTGTCLKIGAKGEELLDYCLTNPHGIIVKLTDSDGIDYICPVVRSGNGIHGNGIDPEPTDEKKELLLNTLQQCFIHMGFIDNSIQVATITDLHMPYYFQNKNYSKYNLERAIPIDKNLYSDYNKDEIQNYILYNSSDYQKNDYYLSENRFYQKRNPIFRYDNVAERDKERIKIIIDSIAYSSIDSEEEVLEERKILKDKFKGLNINDYLYIIGNKDWFIAINNDIYSNEFPLTSHVLNFDKRAWKEYLNGYNEIQKILVELEQERKIKK